MLSPDAHRSGAAPAAGSDQDPALDQHFDGRALVSLRAAVAAHAGTLGLPPGRGADLVLIAHELASNAVRHGGGRGRLRLWRDPAGVRCQVSDDGGGLADPSEPGHRLVPPGATNGRGLWIVRRLADMVAVESGSGGTTVTVRLLLHPAAEPGLAGG